MYLRPLWLPCSGPKSNTLAMSSTKEKQVPLVTNNVHHSKISFNLFYFQEVNIIYALNQSFIWAISYKCATFKMHK